MYDSTKDTVRHIENVGECIDRICALLSNRKIQHDESKLMAPEKEAFDEYTPKLSTSTYGSQEYQEMLAGLKPALDHHYANNRHHPEHYDNGIDGMSLIDVVEMLADWKSATLRHNDGDIRKSLIINVTRFRIDQQLYKILANTVDELWPEER